MSWVRGISIAALALGLASCALPMKKKQAEPGGLVVLLTDFGQRDYYVGAVKGAAYRVNPTVRIDSITHEVAPFDIREGAVTLMLAAGEFPPGTVFVAVVDPGVGTARRAIVLRTRAGRFYVAPDNGLLTWVARAEGVAEVRDISGFQPLGRPPSSTFQGRDLFVPTGALLAGGMPLSSLGPRLPTLAMFPVTEPSFEGERLTGQVIRIDRYGNVVTNIPRELVDRAELNKGDRIRVTLDGRSFAATFATTYGDVDEGEPLALVDSTGYLELAINQRSLAEREKTRVGASVEVIRR